MDENALTSKILNVSEVTLSKALDYLGPKGESVSDAEYKKQLLAILDAPNRVSPGYITDLNDNEIIVVGCNENGAFHWRSCGMANREFGLEMGKMNQISGHAYAIPTTRYLENGKLVKGDSIAKEVWETKLREKFGDAGFPKLDPSEIKKNIDVFIDCARKEQEKIFFVTRLGCGKVGYPDEKIAEFFKDALKLGNVYLPQSFINSLFLLDKKIKTPSELVPFNNDCVSNFQKNLESQFAMYLAWLRNPDNKYKLGENEDRQLKALDSIERVCNAVEVAVTLMYKGLPGVAYAKIKDAMDFDVLKVKQKDPITKEVTISYDDLGKHISQVKSKDGHNNNQIFFRMRKEENSWNKKEIDRKGMFHISSSNRGIVTTQRYSVPGYPCLYLGKHTLGCWEELGRPNLNECMISLFHNVDTFSVFDLRIPNEDAWKTSGDEFLKTAIKFPLVIGCTFKQSDNKAAFKPEYIVPQLLLQYVKELAYNIKKSDVYGIVYTSVTIKDNDNVEQIKSAPDLYDNYVIPVIDIKHELCSKLSDLFELTEPICEEFVRLEGKMNKDLESQINEKMQELLPEIKKIFNLWQHDKTSIRNKRKQMRDLLSHISDKESNKYENTVFGNIEDYLKCKELKTIE